MPGVFEKLVARIGDIIDEADEFGEEPNLEDLRYVHDKMRQRLRQGFELIRMDALKAPARRRAARMETPSDTSRMVRTRTSPARKLSEYQKWAKKERLTIQKQHPRFDFARTQTELSKRWKREKKKRGKK